MTPSLREIAAIVLETEEKEGCRFAPGALDRIAKGGFRVRDMGEAVDYLEAAILAEEIYCPRQGIDRRAEFEAAP